MGVRKIFVVLVTIVACVILGAFVLNVLLPNVTSSLINATEGMIFNATGMSFDFNNDGTGGRNQNISGSADVTNAGQSDTGAAENGAGVTGFQ